MKTKAVWALTSLLLVMSISLAGTMAFAADVAVPKRQFISQIDYLFAGHLEQLDDAGRLLVCPSRNACSMRSTRSEWGGLLASTKSSGIRSMP